MVTNRGHYARWAALLLTIAALAPTVAAAVDGDKDDTAAHAAAGHGAHEGHAVGHGAGEEGHREHGGEHEDAPAPAHNGTDAGGGHGDGAGGHDEGEGSPGDGAGGHDGTGGADDGGHGGGDGGHGGGDGGHEGGHGGHGDGAHVGHDTPNARLTTCMLRSAPGGPRNYTRCMALPGQVPMALYWDVDEDVGTMSATFVAQSIGWAAFAFNSADAVDKMLSGDSDNPNMAVVGMTIGNETTAGVYALRSKMSAGVQPVDPGVYTDLTATVDDAGALVVGFSRPLAGGVGTPAVTMNGMAVNAIWSSGPPSPSRTALVKHVGHGLGAINFARSDLDATSDDGPTRTPDDEASCFPASATVRAASGADVRMDALRVGDAVASAAVGGATTDVFLFTHADAGAISRFVVLSTGSGRRPLVVSPGHYVYLAGGRTAAARTVVVGDALVDAVTGAAVRVTAVSSAVAAGLYNPQTLSGDLAVDGYAVSTYTTAVAPAFAAAALAPVRAAYGVGGGWLWGGVGLQGGWPRLAALLPSGRDTL